MQYTTLGRTGLPVSRLCLGTMNFGSQTDQRESFAIMDRALELGINFFDTADVYGKTLGQGITEELVGKWLAQGGGRRERIVLATKCYGPMGNGPLDQGLSARHIRDACSNSMRRLQTDYIDLYQMHHVDRGVPTPLCIDLFDIPYRDKMLAHIDHGAPCDEILQAMEQLISSGKILYMGSSNFAGWNIAELNTRAQSRHMLGLVSEQSKYSLVSRTIELEVIPACRAMGIGLLPWSPLEGGLLGGVLGKLTEGRRTSIDTAVIDKHRAQLESYESLCRELGEKPADVALAWILANPVVTAPILGPRTIEQLEESMKALEIELSEEVLKQLDQIWPGPGGQAPEAYAW